MSNRDSPVIPSNASLVLSRGGRLIVQQTEGEDLFTVANPSESISSASMLDFGNFVLYNSEERIIWQSLQHPTNSLLPSQQLSPDQELISIVSETDDSRGIFRLIMQTDGNLAQYLVGRCGQENAYYATMTFGSNITLNLEDDGHLYLTNSSVNILKNLSDGGNPKIGTIYLMKIDVDGIFRLYSHRLDQGSWFILWESSTDKCDSKGVCGFNSFCAKMDNEVECKCLDGIDFVTPGTWRSGCERNFIAESCNSSDGNVKYTIRSMQNTVWQDNSFAVLETSTKEDCEKVCLEDCNCEAAFYKDGRCKKQRLPLTHGKRRTDSNIALVKVGTGASINEGVTPINAPKHSKGEVRVDILIIGISLAVFGVLIFVINAVYAHRNQAWAYKRISGSRIIEFVKDVAPRAFTFAELEQATNGFKEELGRGAFGAAFKGVLPNLQKVVAVKRLEKVLAEGEKEFQNEIQAIGKTHNRNLVRLLGWCLDGSNRLLVYEYMSNGSLADILLKPENRPSWDERIRIACDIARGILYLHEECETQIIHCDIKPENILMDGNRCAKISDFGLAKPLKHDQTRTYTNVRGTKGYVAPEWFRKLPVTVKVEIFSFGIMLLEIICCRKSVDFSVPEEEAILEEWAYDCFEAGELHQLVAAEEVIDARELERMVKKALWCIQEVPALRPSMKKILLMLEGIVHIQHPPVLTLFQLPYNSNSAFVF